MRCQNSFDPWLLYVKMGEMTQKFIQLTAQRKTYEEINHCICAIGFNTTKTSRCTVLYVYIICGFWSAIIHSHL